MSPRIDHPENPLAARVAMLEAENARLRSKERAEGRIDGLCEAELIVIDFYISMINARNHAGDEAEAAFYDNRASSADWLSAKIHDRLAAVKVIK